MANHEPMTDIQIEQIESLLKSITPGDWYLTPTLNKIGVDDHGIAEVDFDNSDDAKFCVRAPYIVRTLLAEVKRLREGTAHQ